MAILNKGKTFTNGELVTPQKLHELVDLGTVSGIVNADIANNAAIADSKLAQITTANKVAQSAVANLTTDLAGKAPTAHTHGNITNAGAIGATANLPVVTTTSGVLTTIPAGTSGQVLRSNGAAAPSWLTLATSATTDTTNAGNITSGTLAIARIPTGTTSTTVALGNHTHDATDITGKFINFRFGFLNEAGFGGFETTAQIGTTVVSDAGRNSTGNNILARWQRTNASEVTSIIGTITTTGTTGVAYNTSSDYRLKTNLEPLTNAVARLLQIPVHRFNWLADPDAPKVDGFLAHEAQAIVPESVTGHKDEVDAEGTPIHQGIDQSKLVPLLVAAVQELAARVAALEAR